MPLLPESGSVTAKTIATSAVEPEVMNCFVPLRTQRLPWRTARVLIAAASEPASRLGQAEAGEHFSFRHRHQETLFLLLGAVAQHRHDADRIMHAEDRRDRAVAGRDLFERQRIPDMVGAGPAIFRRHQHAHKAEFSEFGERLLRKPRLAVPFGRMRRQLVAGEFAGRVAQQKLLVGEPHSVTHRDLDRRSWFNRGFYRRSVC